MALDPLDFIEKHFGATVAGVLLAILTLSKLGTELGRALLWPVDVTFRVLLTRNRVALKQIAREDWALEIREREHAVAVATRIEDAFDAMKHSIDAIPATVAAAIEPFVSRVNVIDSRTEADGRKLERLLVIGETWSDENDDRRQRVRRTEDRILSPQRLT